MADPNGTPGVSGMPQYPGAGGAAPPPPPTGRVLAEEPTGSIEVPRTALGIWSRRLGWIFFTILCFTYFTLSDLPQDRISEFVQGNISSALASRGMSFSAKQSHLSLLFGITYDLRDVTLSFNGPGAAPPAHIDEIEVSPSILPLLTGKIGGTLKIINGGGRLSLTGGFRGSRVSAAFKAKHFDIGKIALLKLLTNVGGSAVVNGQGKLSANFDSMTDTNADIRLALSKIVVDAQSIQGFAIPRLQMSQGDLELTVDHGRGLLKTLRIGSPGSSTDDIRADISGDILFGKRLETSTCNLKANFSFSPALMKSFSLLGAILSAGRQPDGSFSYRLAGPLLSPNPIPAGAH